MVKYYVEENLRNFNAWSGGKDTLKKLIELGKVEEVDIYLEEIMTEASDTDINDFLWFEADFIFTELLGMTEEEAENIGYTEY